MTIQQATAEAQRRWGHRAFAVTQFDGPVKDRPYHIVIKHMGFDWVIGQGKSWETALKNADARVARDPGLIPGA